ncbi:MAG TPA: hypothetical protein VMB50_20245 [Myxococcales bacterium]|nr:hypothetical protein [Myxococcales bacterium]
MSTLTALALMLAAPTSESAAKLVDEGVAFYRNFQDTRAEAKLRAALLVEPPAQLLAQAHLYLGLIAFNALKPVEARSEFELAIADDSTIELPIQASPKARIAFAEARADLANQLARVVPAPALPVALTDPYAEVAKPTPRSHALGWTLGALGVAAAIVAVVGAMEVVSYDSFVGSVNAAPGSVTASAAASARASAQGWQVAAPICGAFAVAGVVTAAVTW